MGLVHTIPQTDVTMPAFLAPHRDKNGAFPADWLRSPVPHQTSTVYKMFVPVSYAMEAMHIVAFADGVDLETTGRWRSLERQVALFFERYVTYNTGRTHRVYEGQDYWLRPGVALAATPGTSNHGYGLADDIAAEFDGDSGVESIRERPELQWLKDNAGSFGFALDIHSEPWHWHWYNHNALTQRTVDVLAAAGVVIEDLSRFGFAVPGRTTPQPAPEPNDPPQGDELAMPRIMVSFEDGNDNAWMSDDGCKTRQPVRDPQHLMSICACGAVDGWTHNPIAYDRHSTIEQVNAQISDMSVDYLNARLGPAA